MVKLRREAKCAATAATDMQLEHAHTRLCFSGRVIFHDEALLGSFHLAVACADSQSRVEASGR